MNKYTLWYQQITEAGKQHRDGYTECHHILPKSLGGTDDLDNLTNLTAREHFVCHWLLTKIYPDSEEHWKMLNALRMMRAENPVQQRYETKITSRVYAKVKEEYATLQRERYSGEGNPMYKDKFYRSEDGYRRQKEAVTGEKTGAKQPKARKKIAESKIGKKRNPFSDEWKRNMSKNHKSKQPNFNGLLSEETREKIRMKAIGRKQSDETIKKKADAVRGSKREKKLCPHCCQQIAVNGYARWHGDNCKKLKEIDNRS